MDEIELKLRLDPADLPRLKELALPGAPARAVTRRLESVYFDTPDLRLYRRAVTLRVRRQGRRFVQTVKGPSQGDGLLQLRGEWEGPVASCAPDLDALPDPAARAQLGPLAPADLKPVFESRIRRTARIVRDPDGGDGRVEIAIDHGEIRTSAGAAQEVCEVELELKSGDPKTLYRLALILAEHVPLRVERRTKAERGYALAAGLDAAPAPRKAARIDYPADATVEQVMEGIVREGLEHVAANEAAVLDGSDSAGVHQMRVGLRRLRSALAVFRDLLPGEQRETLDRELKWLTDELGAGRDWDVFAEGLLAPVRAALGGDAAGAPALDALSSLVDEARRRGGEAARAAVRSPRYAALLLTLSGWLRTRGWRAQPVSEASAVLFRPAAEEAARLLDERHRQVRRRGKGFQGLAPEPRHRVRIALKKLRYATEFFRPLHGAGGRGGKAFDRYHRRLADLQESLGHLNDVATAERLIAGLEPLAAEVGAPPEWRIGGGLVVGWHARGVADGEARIVRDWAAFADARPYWTDRS
jgi:triphosphatase